MPKSKAPSKKYLAQLLDKWKARLGLQDWDIRVSFDRVFDIPSSSQAYILYTLLKHTANIHIVDPSDYDPSFAREQDVEASLVHELLHIPIGAAMGEDNHTNELEILVETMTRALIRTDRAGKK